RSRLSLIFPRVQHPPKPPVVSTVVTQRPRRMTRPVASPTLNNREPVQLRTRRAVFIAVPGTETLDLVGPLQVFSLGLCSRQSAPSLQTGGCIAAGEGQRQPLQTRQRVPQFGQVCRQVRIAILDYKRSNLRGKHVDQALCRPAIAGNCRNRQRTVSRR